MDRVVFDTNVYISALVFGGIPRSLLSSTESGIFHLVISKHIIAEIRGVLRVKFFYDMKKLDDIELLLISMCEVVEPKKKIQRIKKDPDDNMMLECAIEGRATYLISGDTHLLEIKQYKKISIISPSQYWQRIAE